MAAHAEIANVIEEDNASRARRVRWFTQQGAHDGVRAARLIHDSSANVIVFGTKYVEAVGDSPGSEGWATLYNDASRFAAGVRVDHMELAR
jgi:hypothetical protein